ncbi:MAG: D-cysteine desulfhydrase family pyridoxal phosphate-dependent enzyme [Thermoproteota archaeon]|jgi:D-cysteine desulfhydrase family pyridoxal phosphate-dependent enzyme
MAPPRVSLAHLPTPIEALPRLSKDIDGANLLVKRDDCTGLAMGGNKARQLEFYFGDARAQGADTVLITGAVQSNYVRMTAAAAAKLGLACHVQLEERVDNAGATYRESGNVLLNQLFGAHIHRFPIGEDDVAADVELDRLANELSAAGSNPYVIHLSLGHPPLGALGYMDAAQEILEQQHANQLQIDEIVVASGSGQTHAGLLYGLRAQGSDLPVIGVCVRRQESLQLPRILDHVRGLDALTNQTNVVRSEDIILVDDFLWPSYGVSNQHSEAAMLKAARLEGLIVDPVYTAKSLAGAIHRAADLGAGKSVLYVHTGGTPALFGYQPAITALVTDS